MTEKMGDQVAEKSPGRVNAISGEGAEFRDGEFMCLNSRALGAKRGDALAHLYKTVHVPQSS